MNAQSFIRKMVPGAQSTMKTYGILASLTIAQAALESGWGAHAPGNNLFGIKANGWTGPTQIITTQETVDGNSVTLRDVFRVYKSWEESIVDHALFLVKNPRYHNLIGARDYHNVCRYVQQDGYATASDYADELISLIEQYKLDAYDSLPIEIHIEAPSKNAACTGNFLVKGWAVGAAGIERVDVYADGKQSIQSIRNLTSRPDVDAQVNKFSWYLNASHSGFSYMIPAGKIPGGTHTIDIAAIGNAPPGGKSAVTWSSQPITVVIPPLICIDKPVENAECTGSIAVSGWAINASGIKRVDVYVDGRIGVASVRIFSARPDVERIMNPYGRYKNADKSGFSCTIEAGKVEPGHHEIDCAAIGNDGSVAWAHKAILIK